MKRALTLFAVTTLLASLHGMEGEADACTGFFIKRPDVRVMAVNYDWEVPGGRLIVNQRGVQKTAFVAQGVEPLSWVSSFGSLTLNQYGREFPIGGINQMGLAMQVLWLDSTVYPSDAPGPAIGALQWVQYCLDSFSSVQQVVDSAGELAISSRAKLHFLACGKSGSCAVVEFLDGTPVIRAAEKLPLPVLANSTYNDSINALDASLGYGGKVAPAEGDSSLSRFVRTATQLNHSDVRQTPLAIDRAFHILADVAIAGQNQWRVVYDLRGRSVHFTTSGNSERRTISLRNVELNCAVDAVQSIDLSADGSGDVKTSLSPLTTEENHNLVRTSVSQTKFLEGTTDEQMQLWSHYPDGLACTLSAPEMPPLTLPGRVRNIPTE